MDTQYNFGTMLRDGVERRSLRTKSTTGISFEAGHYYTVIQDYPDMSVSSSFRVDEEIKTSTDSEGNNYHWYLISEYTQVIDRTPGVLQSAQKNLEVASIAFVTMAQSGTIDDVTAGEHADLFPEWNENGVSYTANQIVRHEGKLYKCIMQHNSQSDWAPGAEGTDALWKQIADPSVEWPEWSQPIGAHDCYNTGDKVTYNGEHYTSLIDGNVWKPDEYPAGWKKEE